MCRFTYYLGDEITVADLVTRPENSLIHQSVHASERPEPLNGDGFGLVWYVAEPDDSAGAVLISSEPLNEGPRWKAIPRNHVALVSSDLSVSMRELSACSAG